MDDLRVARAAFDQTHELKSLPFNAAKLNGLSSRLIESHWSNNYGGSGWVMLGYNRHFQALENYWMADHMHSPATTVPLLVLDMYEHSYQMDYGAATARYVDAFLANINWDRVMARIDAIT